jgi:predicted hotdog family 3-hydroxylacyl-ACP dehydratase
VNPAPQGLNALIGRPARDFVRHREPMLLLDTLVDIGDEHIACSWQVTADSAMLIPGEGVPAFALIESMAQCIAVHSGAKASAVGQPPPLGLLLGTRQFTSSVQYVRPGDVCVGRCEEQVRDGQGLASYACRVELEGRLIASANLAVLELTGGLDTL